MRFLSLFSRRSNDNYHKYHIYILHLSLLSYVTNTSTHKQRDCQQKTCRIICWARGSVQIRSLPQQRHASLTQISCQETLWSFWRTEVVRSCWNIVLVLESNIYQFIISGVFLTSIGANFHHLLLHYLLHVGIAYHRVALTDMICIKASIILLSFREIIKQHAKALTCNVQAWRFYLHLSLLFSF